jgi:hypothetical protein
MSASAITSLTKYCLEGEQLGLAILLPRLMVIGWSLSAAEQMLLGCACCSDYAVDPILLGR